MSDDLNSFKKLEKLHEEKYAKNIDQVKKSIDGNLSGLSFFTNIIDVYFARVLSYIVNMSGGKDEDTGHDS